MKPRVLLIDNYDSFTFNLVQALAVLGADVTVRTHDQIGADEGLRSEPTHLVVSPGPGRPEDAGISLEIIEKAAGRVPVLGVCLGHQALAMVYGGVIVRSAAPLHGKSSPVNHDGKTIFRELPDPFEAGRYHSLTVDPSLVPDELEVTARTADGEIMGLRHRSLPVEGVQFHPESILSPDGNKLLGNFLELGVEVTT